MRHLDASAVVDLWENYPLDQFPALWEWFLEELISLNLAITSIALDEVGYKVPDCKKHLINNGMHEIVPSNAALLQASVIKAYLGIVNEQYGGGVDENDIIIIAQAKVSQAELVTNEAPQPKLPLTLTNYKIPAVCSLPDVNVKAIRLIHLIRSSNRVFG